MECLIAAIHNGADAVYLGGKKFGARAYSNNFNEQELIEAIKICHLYNVKIYVTVNTMIYNEEVEEVINYLKFLYINNVDAVILQDNGIIELARKTIPDLEIHVSTQAHNHNEAGIAHYKEIGCSRVVFDRESSLENIKNIKTNIEKEIFVHGALCICYSGNCLFSALNGGRSANRGMCVGSCRLPYKLYIDNKLDKEGFILSTKDLNTLTNIKEILDANIESLKIEGRMKSKEYVAQITKTYRRIIDAYYENKTVELTKKEETDLLKTYNRDFTKGYLFNENNIINGKSSNHQGITIGKIIEVNNKKITIQLTDDLNQEDAIRFETTNQGMYVNTLYDKKGLLTNHVAKNNICQIDNKFRIMRNKLINTNILKTIDAQLNKELNNIKDKKMPINIYFEAYVDKKSKLTVEYMNKTINIDGNIVETAKKDGYVTTIFGRRRYLPELNAGNFIQRSFGERIAMNTPIQGSAADIIKIAMVNIYRKLKSENLKSKLVLQVHDELIIDACKSELEQVKGILKYEMENAVNLSVPLIADMNVGETWYEAK